MAMEHAMKCVGAVLAHGVGTERRPAQRSVLTCAELQQLVACLRADVVLVQPLEQSPDPLVDLSTARHTNTRVSCLPPRQRQGTKTEGTQAVLTSSNFRFATAEVAADADCVYTLVNDTITGCGGPISGRRQM
jgi:hypothetical protein